MKTALTALALLTLSSCDALTLSGPDSLMGQLVVNADFEGRVTGATDLTLNVRVIAAVGSGRMVVTNKSALGDLDLAEAMLEVENGIRIVNEAEAYDETFPLEWDLDGSLMPTELPLEVYEWVTQAFSPAQVATWRLVSTAAHPG